MVCSSGEASINSDANYSETTSYRHRSTARRVVYKLTKAVLSRFAPFPSSNSDGSVALPPLLLEFLSRLLSMSHEEKISSEKREESISDHSVHGPKHSTDVNVKLANPLAGIPQEKLIADAAAFASQYGLGHLQSEFQKGALVAQDPAAFESISLLSDDDKAILRREITHRWSQPWQLYYLVILCSLAAAVQGVRMQYRSELHFSSNVSLQMDEAVINGANLFFTDQFGLDQSSGRNQWLLGLVNSAPYVCLFLLSMGCRLTKLCSCVVV